jgi:threonine/homoserine/homoserine lactone efflux protein
MIPLHTWLLFSAACGALVATPGPNVAYLVSRTVAQGRAAGFASLAGTFSGSGLHVVAAALGLSALLVGIPVAYQGVRLAGAIYLAWLAWATWSSTDDTHDANAHPVSVARLQLFRQGFLTGVLNPKVAAFQLAFFPQFLLPSRGSLLAQSLALGATQLAITFAGDSLWILAAATVRRWFAQRRWSPKAPRRALAVVFAALAARLAVDDR